MGVSMKQLSYIKAFASQISTKTWLIIGGVILFIIALCVWIAISIVSWLWGQVTTGVDYGKNALSQHEQLLPQIREQAEQLVPNLKDHALALREKAEQLAPELVKNTEQLVPNLQGVIKENINKKAIPLADVSGVDIQHAARFPGLVRSAFVRELDAIKIDYIGKASIGAVASHYATDFKAKGFSQKVMSATTQHEEHQFMNDVELITVSIDQLASDTVSVRFIQKMLN